MSDQHCETCKFFELLNDMPPTVCRRYPPPMIVYEDIPGPWWPEVAEDDWCGEWVIREVDVPLPEAPA